MPADRTNKTKKTPARAASSPGSSPSYPGFIPPHGGYEKLLAYRKSEIIYDATTRFCARFIDKRSRTHDQMVQAAGVATKTSPKAARFPACPRKVN
jgi:hypothetical protein